LVFPSVIPSSAQTIVFLLLAVLSGKFVYIFDRIVQ
jgi:hypothetical protein